MTGGNKKYPCIDRRPCLCQHLTNKSIVAQSLLRKLENKNKNPPPKKQLHECYKEQA